MRHTFPKLFEECMNSSDGEVLKEAMSRLLVRDCDMEAYRLDNHQNTGEERLEASLHTRDHIIDHFVGMVTSIPDSVFLIHEWKLFPRPNQSSCLVFKFSMTGTQMFEFESPCTADDHTTGYTRSNWVKHSDTADRKNVMPTIKFREGGRTGKYDARRRNKMRTIGEYVDMNRLNEDYRPNTEGNYVSTEAVAEQIWDEIQDAVIINAHLDDDDDASSLSSPSSRSVDSFEYEPKDLPVVNVRRKEIKKVNINGVMRFHINADFKVWKIHCVHMHNM